MRLALLTAYRTRPDHLTRQRAWLERLRAEELDDFEWIVVEGDERASATPALDLPWCRYDFVSMSGPFHKSALLNHAAGMSPASLLCPFDVDILPAQGTLSLHCQLATEAHRMLIAGYRLNLPDLPSVASPRDCTWRWLQSLVGASAEVLGPEENPSALRKYLLHGERFGVCPMYRREDWEAVGGVDERYVGWGGEDQDLIERVVDTGRTLARSYDLIYFHMPHGREAGWHDPLLTERNRALFRARNRWLRRGQT